MCGSSEPSGLCKRPLRGEQGGEREGHMISLLLHIHMMKNAFLKADVCFFPPSEWCSIRLLRCYFLSYLVMLLSAQCWTLTTRSTSQLTEGKAGAATVSRYCFSTWTLLFQSTSVLICLAPATEARLAVTSCSSSQGYYWGYYVWVLGEGLLSEEVASYCFLVSLSGSGGICLFEVWDTWAKLQKWIIPGHFWIAIKLYSESWCEIPLKASKQKTPRANMHLKFGQRLKFRVFLSRRRRLRGGKGGRCWLRSGDSKH